MKYILIPELQTILTRNCRVRSAYFYVVTYFKVGRGFFAILSRAYREDILVPRSCLTLTPLTVLIGLAQQYIVCVKDFSRLIQLRRFPPHEILPEIPANN